MGIRGPGRGLLPPLLVDPDAVRSSPPRARKLELFETCTPGMCGALGKRGQMWLKSQTTSAKSMRPLPL